jgi:hypothetical protein
MVVGGEDVSSCSLTLNSSVEEGWIETVVGSGVVVVGKGWHSYRGQHSVVLLTFVQFCPSIGFIS